MEAQIKGILIILALTLIFAFGTISNAIDFNEDFLQTEIDTLLKTDNPEDHIKAIELMKLNGQKIFKSKVTIYDMLENVSDNERIKLEREIIEEMDNLSYMGEDDLKSRNFTDKQVNIIKNFDGSKEMALAAAPSVTVYGGFNNYNRTPSLTTTQMISAFQWNGGYSGFGAPWQDIFATVWSSPFNPTSETGTIRYYRAQNSSYVNRAASVIPGSLRGSHIKMPQSFFNSNGTHWIYSGSIISNLRSYSSVGDVAGYSAYGKNTVSLTPGVSFSSNGPSLGITFSSYVNKVGQARFSN